MSYTAKVKGTRFLRKYSAPLQSPVYAAAIDAQTITLSLCDVPWQKVAPLDASFTSHNADSLDQNVENRDSFDAALFCANHADGLHRAFANAAIYRFPVPDAGVGAVLEEISFSAASDPYNVSGLRINVFSSDSGDIPMNCRTLRGEDDQGNIIDPSRTIAAAVPRSTQTAQDGTDYWYAASDTLTLSPNLTLQNFLFVLVALENYNTSRGNWLEGSGFARNDFSLTTDRDIDWLSPAASSAFTAYDGGTLPPVPTDAPTGRVRLTSPTSAGGISAAYHAFLSADNLSFEISRPGQPADSPARSAPGAMFNARRSTVPINGRATDAWEIVSSVLRVPVAMPTAFRPAAVSVSTGDISISDNAAFRLWIAQDWLDALDADTLANPALYDARTDSIETHSLRLAGSFAAQGSFSFPLSDAEASARFITILISAFMPPDALDPASDEWQGTQGEILPSISILP